MSAGASRIEEDGLHRRDSACLGLAFGPRASLADRRWDVVRESSQQNVAERVQPEGQVPGQCASFGQSSCAGRSSWWEKSNLERRTRTLAYAESACVSTIQTALRYLYYGPAPDLDTPADCHMPPASIDKTPQNTLCWRLIGCTFERGGFTLIDNARISLASRPLCTTEIWLALLRNDAFRPQLLRCLCILFWRIVYNVQEKYMESYRGNDEKFQKERWKVANASSLYCQLSNEWNIREWQQSIVVRTSRWAFPATLNARNQVPA